MLIAGRKAKGIMGDSMKRTALAVFVVCLSALPVVAQTQASPGNPLFQTWTTPFGVPPYDQIRSEHFLPGFQRAIEERRQEVAKIAESGAPATFANTIEALDAAGALLDKVQGVFNSLNSAETNARLQQIQAEVAPMLSAAQDDIYLNEKLFARIKTVWEKRAGLSLNAVQTRLVEETYKNFVRAGANLTAADKQRLRAINEALSPLSVRFSNNLLRETNAYKLVISDKAELAGLPDAVISAASEAARTAGQPGKWAFTLEAPSIWPFLTYAENRELRRQILTAYLDRCDHGDQFDNKESLARIATLRAEKARLLGYPTHADFVLAENMAKTPQKVYEFLNQLWAPASTLARKEAAELQAMIKAEGKGFQLAAWDWRAYSEKVKKARYDLDDNELRPYFVLDNVRQGAFDVASKLYGLKFVERTDIPTYNPEVRTFEVRDADGSHLGVYLVDYYSRPGKRGGAGSSPIRGQRVLEGKEIRPIVVNVCNFTRPTAGQPALLSQGEVRTLFHEFGHALNRLLSRAPYKTLSRAPLDFAELPSQIMENWAMEPAVLKSYARHFKTGAPMPDDLIQKIKNAEKFNQGFATIQLLAPSFLDMDWHTIPAGLRPEATAFEKASMEKIRLLPEVGVPVRSPYFYHIFSGSPGYSAGYYSYIWSQVLDADAFQMFKEKGLFDPATAASFRKNILEKGGTEDALEMYKRFRGREPSVEPLLERRGLKN
jgi:peptidyl-dipeptidase Dcp